MLRSTGFFRAIDCPYWAGSPGGPCRRPYCHFRHRGARVPGAPSGGGATPPAAGLGYDPYNPELPKPSVQRENGVLGRGDESRSDILELELVNQAIEAVRSEVELEQRRYQELLETAREYGAAEPSAGGACALAPRGLAASPSEGLDEGAFPLAFTYTPGSHGLVTPEASYQPTPLVPAELGSKYSLESLERGQGKVGATLEYVPKAMGQPQRYSRPMASSKYVVDNSKPSTDLEYDPLSNYSARHLSRASSRDERATKRPRCPRGNEPYMPAVKKPCDPFSSCDARFSDSEDDTTMPPGGDRPVIASAPKASAGPETKATGKPSSREGPEPEEGGLRETKEIAVQYDVGDLGQAPKDLDVVPPAKSSSPARALEDEGSPKEDRPKKKCGTPPTPSHKDKSRKKDKPKNRDRGQAQGKSGLDKRSLQASSPQHKAEKPNGTKKKPSSATPVASSGKRKPDRPSAGAPWAQDSRPGPQQLPERKGSRRAPAGKLGERKARSLDEGASRDAPKLKKRALSHAELFGDESEDEDSGPGVGTPQAWPPTLPSLSSDSDSDLDSESSLGLSEVQLPKRLRSSPTPTPTLSLTPALPATSTAASAATTEAMAALSSSPSPSSSSSSSSPGAREESEEEDMDYSALEKEVDFDSDPMEECLRIFNESTSVKTEDKGRLARQPPKDEKSEEKGHMGLTTLFPGQKRRISHLTKQGKEVEAPRRGPATPPARPPTAQEVCYRRAQQAQRESASWLQAVPRQPEKLTSVHISAPGEKRRIAHVPNPRLATAPTGAKRTLSASSSQVPHGLEPGSQPLKTRTLSGMASKTTTIITPKRIAHSPSLQSLKKPIIPKEFGGKVPTAIRQRYLNLFIEECLRFCPSNQEAIEKALNEEKVAYDRSPSKNIYLNVAVNTLKKLRGLVPSPVPSLSKPSGRRVVSHEVVLGGKLAAKTSFSLSRPSSPRVEDLKGATLYSRLRDYLLTQEQLKENGYPFPHPERPGGAVIFTAEEKKPKDPSCRICCRCGSEYLVSSSGRCIRDEECYYHWGRLRRNRVAGGWETQYMCCSASVGSVGCQVAKQHVQDGRKENLEGFVRTFEKELLGDAHAGIYALDCEMSYTTYGLELTRVTVVDTDMQVVYDTFVKPENEIVDYNTRFSGVTEADLADTSITLRDVQAVLLSMFSTDTILIGHSLESDLLALKVIHSTVVDTAVLFPHRLGLPYKRSLRNLMADYLRQIIQDNVTVPTPEARPWCCFPPWGRAWAGARAKCGSDPASGQSLLPWGGWRLPSLLLAHRLP
ncbi:RNA exonuclease 1 homolog isoform X1 [Heterocephalus glaber]|uniref:RNA exonuclease 1 homolog isoform X1 n=1 Tax=Heterocephalus glaber TaxID=10181 RepID=A0AAX6QMA9_HETGA|nr:RNA exonuclease 1 homolog isoform X1 [Heterocephalus glaber]